MSVPMTHIYQQVAAGIPPDQIHLNRAEAAAWLKVSILTLKKWGQQIPHSRKGRLCWYRLSDLQRKINSHKLDAA